MDKSKSNLYVPGSVASLLSANITTDNPNEGQNLNALFSKKIKRKRKSQKNVSEAVENKAEEFSNITAFQPSKKKSKKKMEENSLVTKRESIFEERASETKPKKSKQTSSGKTPQVDAKKDERTIFVGNLPSTTDKKNLIKLFRRYGKIESARIRSAASADPKVPQKVAVIKKEFHPVKNTVNAYVVFKERESAVKAQKMNGKKFEGFHIRVDLAGKSEIDHNRSIFIGNVPFDAQEEALRDYYSTCGSIESVRLIRDKKTGLGKGFGYVLFKDKTSVSLALQFANTDTNFNGRQLRVSRCKDEKKETPVKPSRKAHPDKRVKKMKDLKKVKSKPKELSGAEIRNTENLGPKSAPKPVQSKKKKIKQKAIKVKKQKLGAFLLGDGVKKDKSSAVDEIAFEKKGKNKRKRERRALEGTEKKKPTGKSSSKFGNAVFARNRLSKKLKR